MTTELAIRITADNNEALTEFASQYPGLWCKEGADLEKNCNRTHYHGYIQTTLTNNGLRKQIYNIFQTPKDKQGNTTLAFTKVTDKEGYLRYICKGTEKTYPDIVHNDKDYDTNYYYSEYWKTYAEIHKELQDKRNLKKTTKANFKEYFLTEVLPKYDDNGTRSRLTQHNICLLMYEYYKLHDKELPSKMQGQIIVNDLYLRYTCPEDKVKNEILFIYGFIEYYDR